MSEEATYWRASIRRVIIAGIACALALLSLTGARADDTITVQGEDVATGPGGAVTFEVTGYSDTPIGAFGISVTFDDAMLTPISCQVSGVLCIKGALAGELRINGANIYGFSGEITFATIVFATAEDLGTVPVGVTVTAVADVEGTDLSHLAEATSGSVTIEGGAPTTPPGDANCDSKVNAADAIALLSALAGGESACAQIADINCDDKINAADVLALLRALGGLPYNIQGACDPVSRTN
ncbi:MAG TPA: dockerin type I domain-containing protein [Dehalococcoidia bacterium]|nr:dockerin type I domain-containing protein [Dehalococcoidia bacterium]